MRSQHITETLPRPAVTPGPLCGSFLEMTDGKATLAGVSVAGPLGRSLPRGGGLGTGGRAVAELVDRGIAVEGVLRFRVGVEGWTQTLLGLDPTRAAPAGLSQHSCSRSLHGSSVKWAQRLLLQPS